MHALGIDIGGSGVKGAPVDILKGEFTDDRYRIPTPDPATPNAVLEAIAKIVEGFNWAGKPIGCGYPGVVKNGVTRTAANLDDNWIGFDLRTALHSLTDCPVHILNDADAAGIAEMRFGAGRGQNGMVTIVTLGTGIGVSAFIDGELIPNLELGHIEIKGKDAESKAANAARERENLSWEKWAKRVDRYLYTLENLISPDLYIIGGGVSKDADQFMPHFKQTQTPIAIAELLNHAGIIGAAIAAEAQVHKAQRGS